MEERIEVKEKEALIEKRTVWEQGLKEEVVVVEKQWRDSCYVLSTDESGQFHLHHYFLTGFSGSANWEVSCELKCKSAIDTIKWLLHKNI